MLNCAVMRMRFSLYMLCTGFGCWKTRAYWTTALFKYLSDTLVVKSAALWTQSFIINLSFIWTVSSRLGGYSLKRRLEHCIKYVRMSTSSILQQVLKHFYNLECWLDPEHPQRHAFVRHPSCVTGGKYEKVTRSEWSVRNCLYVRGQKKSIVDAGSSWLSAKERSEIPKNVLLFF